MTSPRFTAADLRRLPTLCVGQTDDLKLDLNTERVWLARTTVADGEPFNERITVEQFDGSGWFVSEEYPGSVSDG